MFLTKISQITKRGFRSYHKNIIQHFENPKNVGTFPADTPHVYTGLVGAPSCGDVMKLQLIIKDDIITNAKFKTFGCGSAIASSSFTTELIIGKHIDQAKKITNKTIAKFLNLPPVKLHCSMLAEDAIKNAINKYIFIQTKPTKIRVQRGP